MDLIDNTLLVNASLGYVKDWYAYGTNNQQPSSDNLDIILSTVINEPTVYAAVKAKVTAILKDDYFIDSENKQLKKRVDKELKDKYRFDRLLDKVVWNICTYGNTFVEIRRDENDTAIELHLLESTEMDIKHKVSKNEDGSESAGHGEIEGYIQRHPGKKDVFFPENNVVHISLINITTSLWGHPEIKSLYRTVAAKQFTEKYLRELYQYNKFRDLYHLKKANEIQSQEFVNNLKAGRDDTSKEIILLGDEATVIPGRKFDDGQNHIELLNYYRQQILTLLRVPPIIAGIPDNSNRSNSEVQAKIAFNTEIDHIKRVLANEISYELFPKIGYTNAFFVFYPSDITNDKDTVQMAATLKSIGIDNETILQFFKDSGLGLRDGAKIEEPLAQPNQTATNAVAPSRQPKNKPMMGNQKTGSESSTRPEQLMGMSEEVESTTKFYIEDGEVKEE